MKLSQLIVSTKARQGLTYRQLAERAEEAGHNISAAYLNKLTDEPLGGVTPATIAAVAAALDVETTWVATAVMHSWGYYVQVHMHGQTQTGVAAPTPLTPEQVTEVDVSARVGDSTIPIGRPAFSDVVQAERYG